MCFESTIMQTSRQGMLRADMTAIEWDKSARLVENRLKQDKRYKLYLYELTVIIV